MSPTKVSPFKGKLKFSGDEVSKAKARGNSSFLRCILANPNTLSPFLPNSRLIF
jgi:hypothetical protein